MHETPKSTIAEIQEAARARVVSAGFICDDCGVMFFRHKPGTACYHVGRCDVCGVTGSLTEPRDYGHALDQPRMNARIAKFLKAIQV